MHCPIQKTPAPYAGFIAFPSQTMFSETSPSAVADTLPTATHIDPRLVNALKELQGKSTAVIDNGEYKDNDAMRLLRRKDCEKILQSAQYDTGTAIRNLLQIEEAEWLEDWKNTNRETD